MGEIRFYHLQNQPLEQVLPALLNKAWQNGHKILVKTRADQVQNINDYLWTYRPDSFLPHGTKKEGHAEMQPIFITDEEENLNGADVLVTTHNAECAMQDQFDLCCEMLNGRIEEEVKAARERWKIYKDKGFTVTYWQQNERGGWEQKA